MVDYSSLDDGVLKQNNLDRVTSVEDLESRSWDRDNIEQRVSEIQNNVDTIETILQDIQEQLENIPSKDQLEDEWSKFLDRMPTDNNGDPEQLPRAFYEAERDRYELMLRQAIWQARLKELEGFARHKLSEKFDELLDDFRTLKSESNIQDILEVQDKLSRMETLVTQVEKMGQSFREDKRSLWEMMERVAEEDSNGLTREEVEDAMAEGLDSFVKSNGVFSLDSDELEQDRKDSERREAASAAAEETVEGSSTPSKTYELKNKSLDEKVDVLVNMWDEQNIDERIDDDSDDITKSDIADMTDLSQVSLFNRGLFDKLEDEYDVFLRTP